jgi:hypothetical protein
MYREKLDANAGMLFIFEQEGSYGFWMKNTLIPLDIIWLDKTKKVVYIKKNALPCSGDPCPVFQPQHNAFYVLEVNAGIVDEIGLAEGDYLTFHYRR